MLLIERILDGEASFCPTEGNECKAGAYGSAAGRTDVWGELDLLTGLFVEYESKDSPIRSEIVSELGARDG